MSKYGFNNKYLSFCLPVTLLVVFCLFIQWSCVNERLKLKAQPVNEFSAELEDDDKHSGAHVFGHLDTINLQPFLKDNYNWITLVPYAGQKDIDSPRVKFFRGDSLDMVRRDSIWGSQIDIAHNAGFKVFIKPHIWIHSPKHGKWRSDIFPSNDENWKFWKESYRTYILHYANMSQKNNVELFCIGAELTRLTKEKPEFWTKLIKEVKTVYSGKITYAANWYKEYEEIPFWHALDYIGVQAYFPLVNNNNPSVEQISKGWDKHLMKIESLCKKYNKKALFTEMGYKSTAGGAIKPWEWAENSNDHVDNVSNETQVNCYKAFFNKVWNKDWFAGVHIWQLRSDFDEGRYSYSLDFTPQGKPASKIIAEGFR